MNLTEIERRLSDGSLSEHARPRDESFESIATAVLASARLGMFPEAEELAARLRPSTPDEEATSLVLAALLRQMEGQHRKAMETLDASAPPENVQLVAERLGLYDLFDVIVGEKDITHSKPHPEIFLTAARRLNTRPHRCVVFEDALGGILAAKAAGMRCIAVTTTLSAKQLSGADLIVEDFTSVNVAVVDKLLDCFTCPVSPNNPQPTK